MSCTDNKLSCDRVGVNTFPALIVFEDTDGYEFTYKREMKNLKSFIEFNYYQEFGKAIKLWTYYEISEPQLFFIVIQFIIAISSIIIIVFDFIFKIIIILTYYSLLFLATVF